MIGQKYIFGTSGKMKQLRILLLLCLPVSSLAQNQLLPEYAYDMVAEISMATTAANSCDGAVVNDRNLQSAMTDMMVRLVADGLDPVASVQHLQTEAGQEQVALREIALRNRHGVAPAGEKALCEAIRKEVKINSSLKKIVKFR